MARAFGRILSRIWDDKDFLALESGPQRLYCFLITQANLNHAGLLPLTLRKWSKKAPDLTPERVRADLAVLNAARFIVMDEDSEELLIRTFIRNDDVYKQPRVMGSAVSGALEIESHRLRRALLAEVAKLPLHELSDEPTKLKSGGTGPSIRMQVAAHIDALSSAFDSLDPDSETVPEPVEPVPAAPSEPLPEGGAEGATEPLHEGGAEGVAEPLPEGVLEGVVLPPAEPPAEGDPEGLWGYAYARGPAPTRVSPAPTPSPTPGPLPIPFGASGGSGQPPRRQPLLTLVDSGEIATSTAPQTTEELIADWIDHCAKRPPGPVIARVGKHIKAMLAEGIDPADVRAGIAAWTRKGKDPSVLPSIVNEVMNAGGADHPRGGPQPGDEFGSDAHLNRYLARAAARKAATA